MHSLYLNYGISLASLGLVGFFLTHAKSALISGLASGAILILISFFVNKPVVAMIAKVINIILLAVFTWRSSLAIIAILNETPEKLIPATLLVLMAAISLFVLILSFKKD